jgi:hypothetical protein
MLHRLLARRSSRVPQCRLMSTEERDGKYSTECRVSSMIVVQMSFRRSESKVRYEPRDITIITTTMRSC